ncbi:hypothetical protein OC835_005044, partial [Tilletia horrida]
MFGGATGGFGGFGQQQQAGQQQPGQAGAFGAAQPAQTGFGFGAQPQQAQQPAAGGGLFGGQGQQSTPFTFGAGNNTASNGGGGLFGAQQNKPATTGFGGFGATNTAGTGSSFSFGAGGTAMQPAQQQTGGLFGAGGAGGGAFGAKPAGTGLFGAQQPQTTTFGAVNQQGAGIFGAAGTTGIAAMPTQGSSNPPYQPHVVSEKDSNNTSSNFSYQSITCLPAYRNVSVEELRVQDYQQGRKTGNAGPSTGTTFGGFGQQQQQPGQTGGAFGQPATGGLFGQSQQGATNSLFGQAQQPQQQQQQTGGLFGQQPAAGGGLFGQNTTQQQAGGLFGAAKPTGGLFGQTAQQPAQTGGLFGAQQPAQQQGATGFSFGTNQPAASTGGAFSFGAGAANNQTKPGGLFGATGSTGTNTFGGFGQNAAAGQTGTFGQTGQTGAAGGFSFGAANNAAKPGGLFGTAAATSQPAATGFGGFGATSGAAANQAKPAFSFGQNTASAAPSAFGANTTAQPAAGGGLFGAGASAAGGFGAATTTAAPAAGGGLFGGGAFGAKPAGTGLFGAAGTTAQQQPAAGGLFGNNTAAAGGGLFGAKPATSQPGGLFGGFGAQQQPAAAAGTGFGAGGGGLFGASQAKPGGLFGTGATGGGGLFGNTAQAGTAGGGGLFGSSTGGGLFGAAAQPAAGAGAIGLGASTGGATGFGQSLNLGQQNLTQGQILAQSVAQGLARGIDADPYGTEALFRSSGVAIGAAPTTGGLGQSTMGASLGHQTLLPFSSMNKETKPRFGLGASTLNHTRDSPFRPSPRSAAATLRYRSATPSLGLFAGTASVGAGTYRESTPGATREGSIGPGSPAALRTGSPGVFRALGNDGGLSNQSFSSRPSVKRLVLTDGGSVAGTPNATRSGSVNPFDSPSRDLASARRSGTLPPGRAANFSPAFEVPAGQTRDSRAGVADSDVSFSFAGRGGAADESPSKGDGASRSLFADRPLADSAASRAAAQENDIDSLPCGYKMTPKLSELRRMTKTELRTVRDFTVSRPGFGSVRFLPPVDLSTIADLASIPGGIVQIRQKECYVYPEKDECVPGIDGMKSGYVPGPKAAQGEALNVPAVVSLDKCWPIDKATREPIKDADHVRVKQLINKLKNKAETKFIDFHAPTGTWQFQVEHFSRYGLDGDEEDDEREASAQTKDATGAYKPKLKPVQPAAATSTTQGQSKGPQPAESVEMDEEDDEPPAEALGDADKSDSVYASDEDLEDAADLTMQVQQIAPRAQSRVPAKSPGPAAPRPNDLHAWAISQGVQPDKIQVMQASLFGVRRSEVAAPVSKSPASFLPPARKHARASSVQPETPTLAIEAPAASRSDFATVKSLAALQTSSARARKFTRTELSKSLAKGHDDIRVDAGLSFGRSFRVGWGPGGLLVHNGALTGMALSSSLVPSLSQKRAAEQSITSVRLQKVLTGEVSQGAETEEGRLDPVMEVQLQHSQIHFDYESDCPAARILPSARFHHFAALYDISEHSQEATLWRLGHALFDEIDLGLPELDSALGSSEGLKQHVAALKRKAALSDWLQQAVEQTVEAESRSHVAMGRTTETLFSYLSGHQLQRACMAAIDSGDLHLSTLIAQAPGDEEHRDDLAEQLAIWRKEGVDAHISRQYLRLYELLAGNVDRVEGNKTGAGASRDPAEQVEAFDIAAGLDWKRAFGLHLWYGVSHEAGLAESLASYDRAVHELRTAAPPMPAYRERAHIGELRMRELVKTRSYDRDVLFELIKLAVDPTHDLETALGPCNFGPSQTDYRLPWHLYILLSDALQVRDFQDRIDVVAVERGRVPGDGEGHYSARADALTADFANQLELAGRWTSAVFVLLHLQNATSRRKAIKDVLARCVDFATPAELAFVTQELCVPQQWVSEAMAYLYRYVDDRYQEFLSLVEAGLLSQAHEVATQVLIPEAVVRTDHILVMKLLGFLVRYGGQELAEWNAGGKLYMDYVACVWHLGPLLDARAQGEDGRWDGDAEERLWNLATSIDKILLGVPQLLPLSGHDETAAGEDERMASADVALARMRSTQKAARGQ